MSNAHTVEESQLTFPNGQETRFLEMIFPEQANHYGTLFGGAALNLMGKAAFIAASRAARHAVVMASSEKVTFHSPVSVGQLAELVSRVERIGRSSMTVHVSLTAEVLTTGERQLAIEGWFVLVAVDERGRSVPVMTSQAVQRSTLDR